MGNKAPDLNEGDVLDPPPARVAPVFANATPQQRLAALLRRIDTARNTCKLGAAELRPASTASHTAAPPPLPPPPPPGLPTMLPGFFGPPARPVAHPDTMSGYPGSWRLPQNYTGENIAYGDGGTGRSRAYQSLAADGGMGNGDGSATQSLSPAVRNRGREGRNAGPVQQLSFECQRRRFNPEFKLTMHDDKYKCDVLVQTVFVQGTRYHDNAQAAKTHTAIKALKTVQSWPVPRAVDMPPPSGARQEDPRPSGPSSASGVDMFDPLQARAFVEGFRMGQLAGRPDRSSIEAQPNSGENKRTSASLQSRSRSPRRRRRRRNSRHRSRSPRRYFDGSRHDPSLPSTDKYRPTRPAPLHRHVDQAEPEDNYGRLKEDDYD